MLVRDQMEPLAQYIADTIVMNGHTPGSSWKGYTRSTKDAWGDLIPLKQHRNDEVTYVWSQNHEARIILTDIRYEDIDPDLFDLSERITLASKLKATDTIPFRNGTTEVQEGVVDHWEETGLNELNAVKAGFEKKVTTTLEASGGVEGIAEAKASVVDETTISASLERQTGRKTTSRSGGSFKFRFPPMTEGEARLTWSEDTLQTRIKGYRLIRCKVVIGRRHRYRKYNSRKARKEWRESWTSGSPIVFADVSDLIAVMEKRGSVNTPLFEHFAERQVNPAYVRNLMRLTRMNVDVLTDPFTGANKFKPEIVTSQTLVDRDNDLDEDDVELYPRVAPE